MGSYCELSINGVDLYDVKNTFNGTHLKLFSPFEFIKFKEDMDGEEFERFVFRTTVKKAKIRLEILGCNETKLRTYFNNGLGYQKSNYSEPEDENDKQYKYYRDLTFENYSNALRLFLKKIDISNDEIMVKYDPITKMIFEKLSSNDYLNPFFYDEIYENEVHLINHILDIYMCIICCDEDSNVEYELTDVIQGGWVDETEVLEFYNNFMDTTVIVTEGKTDTGVLCKSLEILFPEHKHLFTFFDFHNYKADGGTSYLAKLLTQLSQIKNASKPLISLDL